MKRERDSSEGDAPRELSRTGTEPVVQTPPSPLSTKRVPVDLAEWKKESFAARASSSYLVQRVLSPSSSSSSAATSFSSSSSKNGVRLFLVRHGESLANVDPLTLTSVADHAVPLSSAGRQQALEAGNFLREALSGDATTCRMWVSPYKRARETAEVMLEQSGLKSMIGSVRESIFLGEQQFGLFEGLSVDSISSMYPVEHAYFQKAIRHGGRFWAKFPLGESRADVCQRVQHVLQEVERECREQGIREVVIVSHGLTMRAVSMMWLERSGEWLEMSENPNNCSVRFLEGMEDRGYVFQGFKTKQDKVQREKDLMENKQQEQQVTIESLEEKIKLLQQELEELKKK